MPHFKILAESVVSNGNSKKIKWQKRWRDPSFDRYLKGLLQKLCLLFFQILNFLNDVPNLMV